MLQPNELTYFRDLLSQQLEDLMGKAARVVADLIATKDRQIDPLDIAAAECSRSTMLRLRDRESHLIRKISRALQRIEDGSFGICEICDSEISVARLKARPVTSHCIKCKTRMEDSERTVMPSPFRSTTGYVVGRG